jgi:hypothetical protein
MTFDLLDKKIDQLKKAAEKYLAKDSIHLANEAVDKMKDGLVNGLTPDVYFQKLREQRPSDFNPKYTVASKDFTPHFDGTYTIEVAEGDVRSLTKKELHSRSQLNTSDPNKPTWYVEFWE